MSRISGKAGTLVLSDSTGRKLEVELVDWEMTYSDRSPTFSMKILDPLGGVLVLEPRDGPES